MELFAKARTYSEKALQLLPHIEDKEKANSTGALMQQELAFCSIDESNNYSQALTHLREADRYLRQIHENKDFLTRSNERLLGMVHYHLKNYDSSLAHYRKAIKLGEGQPVHYITGMIYKGMAEVFLEKNNLKDAKICLDTAEKIADESQYLQLKQTVYEVSKEYYQRIKDKEKQAIVQEKKDSVVDQLLDKRAALLDRTWSKLEDRGVKAEQQSSIKTKLILVVLGLLLLSIMGFVIYRTRKQKELRQFKLILNQLRSTEKDALIVQAAPNPVTDGIIEPDQNTGDEKQKDKAIMTSETEQKLLAALENFESSNFFLDKNLSLTSLATTMSTNTRYLSHVIKHHKKTDFNQYINGLRINYAIEQLQSNPEWRQYKISALAEATGFSTHSQFTAVFKSLKGLSPSAFIKLLIEKNPQ